MVFRTHLLTYFGRLTMRCCNYIFSNQRKFIPARGTKELYHTNTFPSAETQDSGAASKVIQRTTHTMLRSKHVDVGKSKMASSTAELREQRTETPNPLTYIQHCQTTGLTKGEEANMLTTLFPRVTRTFLHRGQFLDWVHSLRKRKLGRLWRLSVFC